MNLVILILIILGIIYFILTCINVYNYLKESEFKTYFDWEAQGVITLIVIGLAIIIAVFWSIVEAIIWIIKSINEKEVAEVNVIIIIGLIIILSAIFSSSVKVKSDIK